MKQTKFSLITTTRDRPEDFARMVHSLSVQSEADIQLIVVDQSDRPYVRSNVEGIDKQGFEAIVLETDKMSLSAARNVAFASADGDIVGFPDDDCWYPPDLLGEISARFSAFPHYSIFTCKTCDENYVIGGRFLNCDADISPANCLRAGNSNSIFIRRDKLIDAHPFDERLGVGADSPFQAGEETDLLLRLIGRGARARYVDDLNVFHPNKASSGRAGQYARGIGFVLRRHNAKLPLLARMVAPPLINGALAFVALQPARAREKTEWGMGLIKGYMFQPPSSWSLIQPPRA